MKIEILKSQIESLELAISVIDIGSRDNDQQVFPFAKTALDDLRCMRIDLMLQKLNAERDLSKLPRLSVRDHDDFVVREDGYYVSI